MNNINTSKIRRKIKSKGHNLGTPIKPRISIFRSNKQIYAQAIDDEKGVTLASSSSLLEKKGKITKQDIATKVGEDLGVKLKEKKVKVAVFDRSGYRYHGRVKNLADGVRKSGIKL